MSTFSPRVPLFVLLSAFDHSEALMCYVLFQDKAEEGEVNFSLCSTVIQLVEIKEYLVIFRIEHCRVSYLIYFLFLKFRALMRDD